jgi:hypothetical protein
LPVVPSRGIIRPAVSRGKQSPIFVKTYDFLVWLLGRTARFPKNERFRMARRLEETAFAFYDLLLQAGRLPASQAGEKRRLLSQRALLQFT